MPPDRSDDTPPLHEADPAWLGQLASGMNWLVAGLWASILFGAITTGLSLGIVAEAYAGILTGEHRELADTADLVPAWFNVLIALGIATLSAVFLVGCWRVTQDDPAARTVAPSLAMTRWTCVPAFVINIPASLALLAGGNLLIAIAALGLKLAALSLLSIGFPASLIYLRHLARRLPDPGLARQTTLVFWGQFAAGLLLIGCMIVMLVIVVMAALDNAAADLGPWLMWIMAPGLVAVIGFFLWWVWLMMAYRSRLSAAHKAARRDAAQAPAA